MLKFNFFNIPSKDEWLFSIKSFIGAMAGFYLAQRIGLPRPFWALLSAYVTVQTFAGATKSKALYRIIDRLLVRSVLSFCFPFFSTIPSWPPLPLAFGMVSGFLLLCMTGLPGPMLSC